MQNLNLVPLTDACHGGRRIIQILSAFDYRFGAEFSLNLGTLYAQTRIGGTLPFNH
jgi:hypothetical protein